MTGFIAVHVGAGYHAENLRPVYKTACKEACLAAIELLNKKCNAVQAVSAAVSKLEDCALTNAGVGSNLTLNGCVECDAGVMDGSSLNFGSVGALSNIKNPIRVAQKVLEEQNHGLLSFGRIPPCTLVGQGAVDWACEHGFETVNDKELTTKTSRGIHLKNMCLLKSSTGSTEQGVFDLNQKSYKESMLLDTVGAVCVDSYGNVSGAVSSGGLLLKHSGRIGQAAVYGAGCWASNSELQDEPSIACSVTGVGEYLIKTMLAKECYQMMHKDHDSVSVLPNILKNCFIESPCLKNVSSKLAGILAVKHYKHKNRCELSWVHSTKSMILGYMCGSDKKASVIVSLLPTSAVCGKSVVGGEENIRL
ncbi:threonine aspartase 1-like [Uloborus diversus]|uniref:threonine aspartase 1-like n=1 Tax=Uloborus diversus TaxID=327109 RepID=UPI0024099C52|nr:threonine aspartase 1-like [Uloborus diversus]